MELNELTDKAIDYILDNLSDERQLSDWEKNFIVLLQISGLAGVHYQISRKKF